MVVDAGATVFPLVGWVDLVANVVVDVATLPPPATIWDCEDDHDEALGEVNVSEGNETVVPWLGVGMMGLLDGIGVLSEGDKESVKPLLVGWRLPGC